MLDILRQLIMAKELYFGNGEIKLFGQNLFFIPSETIVEVIHNNDIEQNAYLYAISKKIGFIWFKNMISSHGITNREIIKWGLQTLSLSGWGNLTLKDLDEKNSYSKTLMDNSIISKLFITKYGLSEIPVDHIVRGLMAGGGCIIHNNPSIEMIETKCMAKGDMYCEIVARERSYFLGDEYYKKQLGNTYYDIDLKTGLLVKK